MPDMVPSESGNDAGWMGSFLAADLFAGLGLLVHVLVHNGNGLQHFGVASKTVDYIAEARGRCEYGKRRSER